MKWVNGTIVAVNPAPGIVAEIKGDNGVTYRLKNNGFAPEDRSHGVRLHDRVRFEDRLGYVMDLRVTSTGDGPHANVAQSQRW